MKLEILQENLNYCLSLVSRVIATKPQVPILANILFVAKDGKLTLTASNLETSIIVEVGAKIETEGEFTLPGRTIAEIVSSLSAQKLLLEVTEGIASLKSGGFHAKLNGIPAPDYPQFSANIPQDSFWELSPEALSDALRKTVFAAAGDETRAALTGVLLKPKEKGLIFAATDGFRLSVVDLEKVSSGKKETPGPVIIPARTLAELARILEEKGMEKEEKEKTVKIYFSSSENQALFDLGDIKIISRLIAGNFPEYEKIIPSTSILKIVISAEELTKSLRLASIFARESANIVKLKIENSKLKISANATERGENESELDIEVQGSQKNAEFSIAFNYRYLLDFLAVTTGELAIEFSTPTAPGVFRENSSPNFLHLVMPVRVQG